LKETIASKLRSDKTVPFRKKNPDLRKGKAELARSEERRNAQKKKGGFLLQEKKKKNPQKRQAETITPKTNPERGNTELAKRQKRSGPGWKVREVVIGEEIASKGKGVRA